MDFFEKYQVEKLDEKDSSIAYIVKSNRAEYALLRNKVNPWQLFAINMKTMNANAKIGGYSWFSDGNKINGVMSEALKPLC